MPAPPSGDPFKVRQFIWGASNGVFVLLGAAWFWFALGLSRLERPFLPWMLAIALGVIPFRGAVRLRRSAGRFSISEMRHGTAAQQQELLRIRKGFVWATLLEAVLVGASVAWCGWAGRMDLLWPAIAISVSIHFIPIGRTFGVTGYYWTAAAGCAVGVTAIAAYSRSDTEQRLLFIGLAMGITMLATGGWLVFVAPRLARRFASRQVVW